MGWADYNRKKAQAMTDAQYFERYKARTVVDAKTGCWLWQGFIHAMGYGDACYRGKNHRVHRAMWIVTRGAIPSGMHVCHTCDVRHCINPDHLWLGTNRENIRDAAAKGRIRNRNNGPLPETPIARVQVARSYKKPYQRKSIVR